MPPKSMAVQQAQDQEHHTVQDSASATGKARNKKNKQRVLGAKNSKDSTANSASTTSNAIIAPQPEQPDNATPDSPSDTETIATEPLPQFQFGRALPQPPTSYIEVPVLSHYELREIPSVGDENDMDEGLFATQQIDQGTRLMSERPLFTLPAPGDQVPPLMAAYSHLPPSDQALILTLRPAPAESSPLLLNLRFLTDRLGMTLQTILCKPPSARTAAETSTLAEMQPKFQTAMTVYRIAARWHANRCSLLDTPLDQRLDLPPGTPITGLFVERARIRHSCVPNCFASYDATLGRINVHAARNINRGEELTLAAFADTMFYAPAEERAQQLAEWGLTCSCEACTPSHPQFKVHEAARSRAHTRVVLLTDMLTRLESDEIVAQTDLETAQSTLLALLADLNATTAGSETAESIRWRCILLERILPARARVEGEQGLWRKGVECAREAERVGGLLYGGDRGEVLVLRGVREGVEGRVGE